MLNPINHIWIVGLVCLIGGRAAASIREFQISPTTAGDQERVQAEELESGRMVFVWEEQEGANSQVAFRLFDPNGPAFTPAQRVDSMPGIIQTAPAVAALSGGGFAVAFAVKSPEEAESYNVRYQVFSESAKGLFESSQTAHVMTRSAQFHPAIAPLVDGGFVIAFADLRGADQDIYHRRFDSRGEPLDEIEMASHRLGENPVSPGDQGNVDLSSLPGGGFVMVFEDRETEHAYGIRIGPEGNPEPVPAFGAGFYLFRLDPDDPTTRRVAWAPRVSAFSDGGFMVVYNSESEDLGETRGVRARYFRADGNAGSEFAVGQHKLRWQDADVQTLPNQTAAIIWQTLAPAIEGPWWLSWMQPWQQNGTPLMPAFPMGADTTQSRRACRLSAYGQGGWMASWESEVQDGDGWGAYARLVAPLASTAGRLDIAQADSGPSTDVRVEFRGEPFECYELQSTLDFRSWIGVFQTNTDQGRFEFQTSAGPGDTPRFYRVERIFFPGNP